VFEKGQQLLGAGDTRRRYVTGDMGGHSKGDA